MKTSRSTMLALFISIAALLSVNLLPALAAQPVPFSAAGAITSISPGYVYPAGDSDRWRVSVREITGNLAGAINGAFIMTYKANVDWDQSGNLHGRVDVGSYTLNVNGKIQPIKMVPFEPFGELPMIELSGHWNLIKAAQGEGGWTASAIFIPIVNPDGSVHVGPIVASAFDLTGQWQP